MLYVWKKTEQQQWLNGRLHGHTTTSITASDITHVIGCYSACCYCRGCGLLLVAAAITDDWLLHLDFFFFDVDCYFFLSCRPVAGTTHTITNAVATALTITVTPPLLCIVLFCAAKYCQCTASAPDYVTTSTITITTLAVLSRQTQNSLRLNSIGTFHKQCFPSSFDHVHLVIVKTDAQCLQRRNGIKQASFFQQKIKIIVGKVQETCQHVDNIITINIDDKQSISYDRLAWCIKMTPTACAIVDARLSPEDMSIAGSFMIVCSSDMNESIFEKDPA